LEQQGAIAIIAHDTVAAASTRQQSAVIDSYTSLLHYSMARLILRCENLMTILERFHLLFVSDVRTVYENFVLFILDVVFSSR